MNMEWILIGIMLFFWGLLIFYSVLTISGVYYRSKRVAPTVLTNYPSVSILIPAHNEGIVIKDTLSAMAKLDYPGELNVYLLNDNSTDDTQAIGQAFQQAFSRIHCIQVPPGNPKGKSRVLNYGLSIITSKYFLVYDADNEPEPDAVKRLVEAAEVTKDAAGAVGYVKTKNEHKNWLTRMIALEFQVFQLLMQCGRWQLFKLGSLAGTNMLLQKNIVLEMGGYDEFALAEDAELTIRLTTAGYVIPVVAEARTWEQEPENLKTFIKQRTRWLIGNIYLLEKLVTSWSFWKKKAFHLSLQHILVYLLFVVLLLFSHIFLIGSFFDWFEPKYTAPVLFIWFMSYVVYTAQLFSAIVVDGKITPIKIVVGMVMYFTYAQLFLVLLTRSLVIYFWKRFVKREAINWDKTNRFKKTLQHAKG